MTNCDPSLFVALHCKADGHLAAIVKVEVYTELPQATVDTHEARLVRLSAAERLEQLTGPPKPAKRSQRLSEALMAYQAQSTPDTELAWRVEHTLRARN